MIESKHIQDLFQGQLNQIQDSMLKEKTISTWVLGCQKGHWTSVEDLKQIPFTLLTHTHGINLIDHTIAVTEGAVSLAHAQKKHYIKMPYIIDFDQLYTGGLLHDVGKLLEIESDGKGGFQKSLSGKHIRHTISGSVLACEVGLPERVINVIACHAKEGDGRPQTIETILIHQADFATFNPLVMKQRGLLIE